MKKRLASEFVEHGGSPDKTCMESTQKFRITCKCFNFMTKFYCFGFDSCRKGLKNRMHQRQLMLEKLRNILF